MRKVTAFRRQAFTIVICLIFMGAIGTGILSQETLSSGSLISLCLTWIFFLSLIFQQLGTWSVTETEDGIILSNFFGLNKVRLVPEIDFEDAESYVIRNGRNDFDRETGVKLILTTTKGKFRFSSENYPDFEAVLQILFRHNQKMRYLFERSVRDQRKNYKPQNWIYYLATIIILVALIAWGFMK